MRPSAKRLGAFAAVLASALLTGCQPVQAIPPTAAPAPTVTPTATSAPEPMKALTMDNLIPLPVSVAETGDSFTLSRDTVIRVEPASDEMLAIGKYLADALAAAVGLDLPVEPLVGAPQPGSIVLSTANADTSLGQEGYDLTVTAETATLRAPQPEGVFRGIQTLRQLLPAEVDSAADQPAGWLLPGGVIRDQPRYPWRGVMLDVARHFRTVDDVKRVIDLMALYKLNHLHLHLTDDQGWRLMIESWPKLAEIGGSTAVDGDPGGYYTQAEYSELVEYARSRYIDIVPEIDMPGHTNAALASYPDLNCDDQSPALYTGIEVGFSSFCIDKEITYTFLDDVIGELAALTPGPYIHIGGDEAHSTPDDDYRRFVQRVQQIVQAHGKQMLGWAEIAQIDLAPDSVAQYWQGDFGSRAATQGVKVIMSPADRIYLDMKYDDSTPLGLNWAGNIDVERAYSWDPAKLFPDVGEDDILGVEAPVWTETLDNMDDLEFMVFPRLLGLAEIGWSPAEGRSWDEYRARLAVHSGRLEALGVNVYRSWMED